MKNIHIIPTDKPSRLHITYRLDLYPNGVSRKPQGLCKNQHIYITTDEEIKPNTYCLINGVLCKTEIREGKIVSRQLTGGATMDICKSEYLEIILTTDQDLIKDGVQAIDDEFLEWFVNNPSCEKVEVKMENYYASGALQHNLWRPKIIIPQEEPKQEDENYLDSFGVTKSEFETFRKFNKQKTLEEAALRLYPDKGYEDELYCDIGGYNRELFIEGATYIAETMYSYDELRRIAYNAYCRGQLDEPTEGKFNKWIVEFKK